MPISYQSVTEFARTHGDVRLEAPKSGIRILKNGETDVIDLVEKATDFWFDDDLPPFSVPIIMRVPG